jgi:hypothetical protein
MQIAMVLSNVNVISIPILMLITLWPINTKRILSPLEVKTRIFIAALLFIGYFVNYYLIPKFVVWLTRKSK